PVPLTQPQREGGGPTATKDAYGAAGWPEAMLDVERLPGAALLVLGEGGAGVGVVVPLGTQVGQPRHRAALEVLGEQAVRAANGGVGVVVRAHRPDPAVHLELVANRAVDDRHRRGRAGRTAARA